MKEKKNDSHKRGSFSSQIVCRTFLCFVSLLSELTTEQEINL